MSIKYYQPAKDEELPDEFCVVRDVGGEPSEYAFYVPEDENAKLRKLALDLYEMGYLEWPSAFEAAFADRMRELGLKEEDR